MSRITKIPILFSLLVASTLQCKKEVEPDNIFIPDENLLHALIELGIDANGDSIVSPEEVKFITSLDVNGREISDMTGIEAFENLYSLSCGQNLLTSLDLSNNPKLMELNCYSNQLTSLDITQNSYLESLRCYFNELGDLDVSNNKLLVEILCDDNPLTEIDCSDLSNLEYIRCHDTPITTLKLEQCSSLKWLLCHNNLTRRYHPQLSVLDLSDCLALEGLACYYNLLTTLDLSNNPKLTNLNCEGNPLESLNISHNTSLNSLDISQMPTLQQVCVWELPFPFTKVMTDTTGSPYVYFTTNCN